MKTGAQIVVDQLTEHGVDLVFGYPGATILPLYDEIFRRGGNAPRHILTAHEQGAAHAADGYARASGKTAVCLATSGPGATNLTTGIAAAYMDSSPIVFITCNVETAKIGRDSFQEVDITGIAMPITKMSEFVKDVDRLSEALSQAFFTAGNGRKGPVLIDIAYDVLGAKTDKTGGFSPENIPYQLIGIARPSDTYQLIGIEKIAAELNVSERITILAGGGARGAIDIISQTAERLKSPVVTTMMGAFPGGDAYYAGVAGFHKPANAALRDCQTLLAVGTRFSERIKLNPKCRVIHIDIDRAELGKNVDCVQTLRADATAALRALLPHLSSDRAPWLSLDKHTLSGDRVSQKDDRLSPQSIVNTIDQVIGNDKIVTTDVGQHQLWTVKYLDRTHPRRLITSGGFGAMGFGLGAAIGAAFANPGQQIVHITGDGSLRMNSIEWATVSRYKLPILTVLFNNNALGLVKKWQKHNFERRFFETELGGSPDYVKLAAAYGIPAEKANSVTNLREILQNNCNFPMFIECFIGDRYL